MWELLQIQVLQLILKMWGLPQYPSLPVKCSIHRQIDFKITKKRNLICGNYYVSTKTHFSFLYSL
ncbi:hypothetical protein LEP1GSC044_3930 [Leptospira kirschneri serovar Grippotyphosa str. RM52]|nr:hypothetical protein LEP1GSC044_3930 [Leptospira kirschneri serovar Grippotyphosa str. RM52]EMK02122.1 hypothetical protein LEP1GSC176_0235 [Leptospira kirschneri str. MMD1493]